MAVYEFKTRVSYDDVDENMMLTLRGTIGMMQEAAIIHSDLIGYSACNTEKTGVIWMLVRWRVRRISEAKWNEKLIVRTWPRTMDRVTSERDFEIVDENNRVVAIGESVWVLVSADTRRIIRIPQHIAQAYDLTERKVFDTPVCEYPSDQGEEVYSGVVRKRDIDSNHHVNNRVYLDYANEGINNEQNGRFSEVRIHYRKQLLLGETVKCLYQRNSLGCRVDVCSNNSADIRATVEFYE